MSPSSSPVDNAPNPALAATRTRSLGGCATCRTRHVKCDEARPVCSTCKHFGLSCGGYEVRISFDCADKHAGNKFRRPLFTESERENMSNLLVASVEKSSAHQLLSQIDEHCQEANTNEPHSSLEIQRGPFGAFRVRPQTPDIVPLADEDESIYIDDNVINNPSVPLVDQCNSIFDDVFWNLDETITGQSSDQSDSILDSMLEPEVQKDSPLLDFSQNTFEMDVIEQVRSRINQSLFSQFVSSPLQPRRDLPHDAAFLLSNYRKSVIGAFSPLKYHKTPWHILHLPSAMNALASLTLGDFPGNASLSVFYAVLSISAYSLRGSSTGNARHYWSEIGSQYKSQAQLNLKSSLRDAFSYPKKAKYKEILMSLLTMVTVLMFAGNLEHSQCYLLDAEKFIRLRGLTKRHKSRKVRLLHHCYAYLRIFNESTIISVDGGNRPENLDGNNENISVVVRKVPPFRLTHWEQALDQKLLEIKSFPLGENDLHLEIPGRWDYTLYPDIYGIPESFLVLLSQTVRLGNEKDIAENAPGDTPLMSWQEFSSRAKVLERCISKWEPPSQNYPHCQDKSVDQASLDSNRRMIDYMVRALHYALSIYFYRRIYDVDAAILQQRVEQTRDCLKRCQEANAGEFVYSAAFLWPGFIAACEALDPDLQESFSTWFSTCAEHSGLQTFSVAREIAENVWKKRKESNDTTVSWIDLIKKQEMRLLYF